METVTEISEPIKTVKKITEPVNSTGSFGRLIDRMIAVDIFYQLQNL